MQQKTVDRNDEKEDRYRGGLYGKLRPPFNPSHGPVYALNSNVSKSRRRGRAFPFRNIQPTLCLLLPSDTYPRGCTGPLVIAIVKSITITRCSSRYVPCETHPTSHFSIRTDRHFVPSLVFLWILSSFWKSFRLVGLVDEERILFVWTMDFLPFAGSLIVFSLLKISLWEEGISVVWEASFGYLEFFWKSMGLDE